jgi:hypothetical protein
VNPFHFAVVVGIDEYPGLSNLLSAGRDAQAFYDWLVGAGGLPAANVKKVSASGPFPSVTAGKPTRTEINNALRDVNAMAKQATKAKPLDWEKTRLYFYVSGHGVAPEGSEAALLMANADNESPENIPCAAYLRRYEKCQIFREVVVFADCCRLAKTVQFDGPPFICDDVNVGTVNGLLAFATQSGDAAYEPGLGKSGDEARSYFTQALIEGLNGNAADPGTGEINSITLAKYAAERVKILTLHKEYPQVPKMPVDLEKPIVFRAANPAAAKIRHTVTIFLPAGFVGTAELVDSNLKQIAVHNADTTSWTESVEDGLYQVRPLNGTDSKGFGAGALFRVLGEDCDIRL